MSKDHLYTLEIHIDSRYITKQSLIENAEYALKSYLGKIDWDIDDPNSVYHRFIVIGDINSIDNCHNLIQQSIINRKDLKFYHYIDEVGDKIRELAYPILAGIEQHFRAFINKVLVEVLGFDWWEKYKLKEIPEKVNQRYNDYKKDQAAPSFLECSDFDHLVNIIMAEVSELPLKKDVKSNEFSNIVKNISETINDCQTLDEFNKFKRNWNEQNKIISLWGIFASYFEDQEEWEKLKKELQSFVIDVRNKVMHHRPIRFHILKTLEELQKKLITIFNSAKSQLSEVDKQEVKQKTERILNSSHLNNLIEQTSSRLMSNQMQDLIKQASMPPIRSHLDDFIKPTSPRLISNQMQDLIKQASMPPTSSHLDSFIKPTSSRLMSNPVEDFIHKASIPPIRSHLNNLIEQTSSRLMPNPMEDFIHKASIPPTRSHLNNLIEPTSSRLMSNLMEDFMHKASIPPTRSHLDSFIKPTSPRLISNQMQDLIKQASMPPTRSNPFIGLGNS
jgi:hypothetical protein